MVNKVHVKLGHWLQDEDDDLGQVSGEEKAVGSIGIRVYMRYFLAGCGGIVFFIFFVLNLTAQVIIQFLL